MQEAIRLGIVPKIDYAAAPITFDMSTFPIFAGEVKNQHKSFIQFPFHGFIEKKLNYFHVVLYSAVVIQYDSVADSVIFGFEFESS